MILKIVRYLEQDWWILDDIRKISKTTFKRSDIEDAVIYSHDIHILDYEANQRNKDTSTDYEAKDWDVLVLVCRRENGEEFSIIFDTIAYLLNDNGQTIEKIVANYNVQ